DVDQVAALWENKAQSLDNEVECFPKYEHRSSTGKTGGKKRNLRILEYADPSKGNKLSQRRLRGEINSQGFCPTSAISDPNTRRLPLVEQIKNKTFTMSYTT